MSLPAPLMFTVGLIDQITKPIAKIRGKLNGLSEGYQKGTMQMASGVAGIAASGYSLFSALQPALEIDRALGEAKGAGLADASLKTITKTAMEFSLQYGKSAVDVIGHAEKMRTILGNVPDHVLASTTQSSATLAMAMKSDADTISKYVKNLTGNYADQANALGTSNFVAKIAGMTAHAKQMFGTELSELEGMIDGMHSLPSTLGVAMEEQFAVMAMLNKQMGQGDAVTQYTNYLEKIVGAQDKLGVKLTDSNGQMLPIVETLEKLKPMLEGKSGDQAWKFLDDAGLGDGSLMIINMIKNLDGLKNNIEGFKNVNGLDPATKMAAAMTSQSDRLAQSWFVIRAAIGSAILPAFNSFVGKIAEAGNSVLWFTDMFPNITRWLGYIAVGFMVAVAAGGLFTLMMGAGKMAMTTWGLGVMLWTSAGALFTSGLTAMRGVMLALNIAMYANPIGLIVAGIAAAVVAVGAIIYYWDELKATMSEWGWLTALGGMFSAVWEGIRSVFTSTIDWIIDKLNMILGVDIKTNVEPFDMPKVNNIVPFKQDQATGAMNNAPMMAPNYGAGTVNNIVPFQQNQARAGVPSVEVITPVQTPNYGAQNANNIVPFQQNQARAGVPNVEVIAPVQSVENTQTASRVGAIEPVKANTPRGGISQQIANANTSKSTTVGNINIYPQKVDPNFANYVEMHS
jgi:hypothetical protein